MAVSNLPISENIDSSDEIKSFFNNYFNQPLTFPATQIDAVVGFFIKRGFEEEAAKATAIVLLSQAKVENVNVFKLLDTLKGVDNLQLSQVVTEVLNTSRDKTSFLGFNIINIEETFESRNIRP